MSLNNTTGGILYTIVTIYKYIYGNGLLCGQVICNSVYLVTPVYNYYKTVLSHCLNMVWMYHTYVPDDLPARCLRLSGQNVHIAFIITCGISLV